MSGQRVLVFEWTEVVLHRSTIPLTSEIEADPKAWLAHQEHWINDVDPVNDAVAGLGTEVHEHRIEIRIK